MTSKSRLNFAVDIVIGLAFLITTFSFKQEYLHIIAGLFMIVGVIVHLGLHRKWVVSRSKRRFKSEEMRFDGQESKCKVAARKVRMNYLLDIVMGIMFILSSLSGIALIFSDETHWLRMHIASSSILVLGVLVHVILHWRWTLRMLQRTLKELASRKRIIYDASG